MSTRMSSDGSIARSSRLLALNKGVYDSNRKRTVILTWAGTGWPLRVAGSYWYCFTASTAGARSEGGPESARMKCTSPSVPTTASITTFPVSKSRRSSSEATARTDLINFGGTMTLSSGEATMGSEVALAVGRTIARFPGSVAEADVLLTAGCAVEPLDAKG